MTKEAFVALVTCFNDDETVNYAATRAQVRRQVAAGNNIMCAGTNGDFTALTFDEKVRLCGEVVDEVGGKAKVIVNAGMPATFETILLAREFEKIGVDGIAVITPFFIQVTQDGLVRHFSAVADAVTTPVYLYDIPARTQNHIEPATAKTLAAHGNIAGIKDSGGAQDTLEAYLQVGREVPGFEVYSGPDHLVRLVAAERRQGLHLRPRQCHARHAGRHRPGLQRRRHRRRGKGAGGLRRLPQGPLHSRLSASTGEAFALPDGRLGRGQPPAGAAA